MIPIDRGKRAAARAATWILAALPVLAGASVAGADDWPRWESPEQAGFSSERLAEAERLWQQIDDAPVASFFLAYKGRQLVAFGDVTADHECHSVRKSFLSALYGIEIGRGRIDPQATLAELEIDDDPPLTEAEKEARVVDLLMARSGVYHEAACETQEARDARPERGSHAPGEFWYYNNWDFNALGTIYQQQTGRDIFTDFKRKIARRVGMQEFRASRCHYSWEPQYSEHPCYRFRMSARDRARFGQLFLQGGRWGNRQIVPREWVEASTQPLSDTEWFTGVPGLEYGYMWWADSPQYFQLALRDPRLHHLWGFSANGNGGQLIMVLPDAEMVLVFAVDMFAGGDLTMEESVEMVETVLTAREIVDLEARKARLRETTAAPGDTIRPVVKVRNRGREPALPSSVTLLLAPAAGPADQLVALGDAPLRALAGGRRATVRVPVTVPATLEPGAYRLLAVVDGDKANYDLRRANNLAWARGEIEIR